MCVNSKGSDQTANMIYCSCLLSTKAHAELQYACNMSIITSSPKQSQKSDPAEGNTQLTFELP